MENTTTGNPLLKGDYIPVNRTITRLAGLEASVLFSEFYNAFNYWQELDALSADGFFYCTVEDAEEKTGLTKFKQSKAVAKLEKLNLVEMKVRGMPAKRYIKIDKNTLKSLLSSSCQETSQQEVKLFNNKKSNYLTTSCQETSQQEVKLFDRNKNRIIRTDKRTDTTERACDVCFSSSFNQSEDLPTTSGDFGSTDDFNKSQEWLDEIRKHYPRAKQGNGGILATRNANEITHIRQEGFSLEEIIGAVEVLKTSETWTKENGNFIPRLERFLFDRLFTAVDSSKFKKQKTKSPELSKVVLAFKHSSDSGKELDEGEALREILESEDEGGEKYAQISALSNISNFARKIEQAEEMADILSYAVSIFESRWVFEKWQGVDCMTFEKLNGGFMTYGSAVNRAKMILDSMGA